jgi:hypothetical protein
VGQGGQREARMKEVEIETIILHHGYRRIEALAFELARCHPSGAINTVIQDHLM